MPRKRKDQQAPAAAPGQPYGENQDQIQAQNVIPLPNMANAAAGGPPMPQGAPPGAGGPPVAGGNPDEALLAAATNMPAPQGDMFGPSQRPAEPITAGMAMGPGPGPEAMGPNRAQMRTVADTYRMLADVTGNALYLRLAEEAMANGA